MAEVKKYVKKPVQIEAIQLTQTDIQKVYEFMDIDYKGNFPSCENGIDPDDGKFKITTLEGVMVADIGDFIIKGVKGEFYPCKPDIFEQSYREVGDSNISPNNTEHILSLISLIIDYMTEIPETAYQGAALLGKPELIHSMIYEGIKDKLIY